MTYDDLQALVDYHYWARDRVLDAADAISTEQLLASAGGSFSSIRDTLVHIYSADWVWYSRWSGSAPTAMVDPQGFPDVRTLRGAWSELEAKTRQLLAGLGPDGIATPVAYRLMDGSPRQQVLWHLVQHVVNHGTYHRGQITTLLRQAGAAPPKSMDLVAFYRERDTVGT